MSGAKLDHKVRSAVREAAIHELSRIAGQQRRASMTIHVDSILRIASDIADRVKLPSAQLSAAAELQERHDLTAGDYADSLRSVAAERDEAMAERDALRAQLTTAERERDEALGDGVLSQRVCDIENDRAQLRSDLETVTEERDALIVRRDELLALVVKVTRETPYPAELDECRSARSALIAEVGTLRSQLAARPALTADEVRAVAVRAAMAVLDDAGMPQGRAELYAAEIASRLAEALADRLTGATP